VTNRNNANTTVFRNFMTIRSLIYRDADSHGVF
jgi:hypothetical protein